MQVEEDNSEVTGRWRIAGIFLLACSACLIIFNHSLPDCFFALVAGSVGAVILSRKNYLFIPSLLLLFSSLFLLLSSLRDGAFGYLSVLHSPVFITLDHYRDAPLVIMGAAVGVASYGWLKGVQAKAVAKR